MLVTLPFLLLLLDFWPFKRVGIDGGRMTSLWPLIVEKIPFFLLTAVSCVITFFAQRSGEAVVSLAKVSLLYRLENAPVAVVGYLQNFFWPTGLCAIYPMPETISALKLISSLTALVLVSVAAWRWRKTKPYFITGWLWFLGTLVPVIGLVQVGGQAMADRYTYIPSIGFFIAVVFLAAEMAAKIQTPKIILTAATLAVLLACILATEFQLPFWRNGETLFRRAVAVTQNNDIALINLGSALEAQGRFTDALSFYREAEKIDTHRYQLHNNLGNVLGLLGRHDESLAEYREASRLRPDIAFPRNGAGLELAAMGDGNTALQEFAAAARLDNHFAAPHLEIAKILFKQGNDIAAAQELRTAAQLDPENYQTLASAARYLAASENAAVRSGPDALAFALQANELSGHQQPMVYDILGMAFAANDNFTNAQICAQNALDLASAAAMKNTGQIQERLELYKKNRPWRESFRAPNAAAGK
jgi:tetratricopeptide (TPR) repeat protein